MLNFRTDKKSWEVLLKGEMSRENFISREFCATKRSRVGSMTPPDPRSQDDDVLMHRTYDYITLHSKNDFVKGVKLMILRWR